MNRRFPIYLDLNGRTVVVLGGGTIAARRIRTLAEFGPRIRVVSPEIQPELLSLPGVTWVEGVYEPSALEGADFVLACTGDPAVNREAVLACRRRGIPVNNASDQDDCDFHFPAVAIRGSLVVGVNAAGTDHSLVRRVAAAIRALLEREL